MVNGHIFLFTFFLRGGKYMVDICPASYLHYDCFTQSLKLLDGGLLWVCDLVYLTLLLDI